MLFGMRMSRKVSDEPASGATATKGQLLTAGENESDARR
jgi:hypothetical protein